MRASSTYRAARRNAARCLDGGLQHWQRSGYHAGRANGVAKLAERRKQCEAATLEAVKAALNAEKTGVVGRAAMVQALREYWSTHKRTRVVARILRELGPAPKAA